MKLENKVAIITGGTKGIGYGIAEEYLKEGAKITICSRNAQEGVKAAKELGKLGEVLYLQADVSSIEDNQMLVDETVKKYGRLDIFVANAGINDPDKTHYLHITEEQYDRILGVNLKGLFFGGQLAARQMVKQGQGGAIVNISLVGVIKIFTNTFGTSNESEVHKRLKNATVYRAYFNVCFILWPDPAP